MRALDRTNRKPHRARRWTRILPVLMLVLALTACGESEWTGDDAQVTTLGINKDGKVREIIVEEFAESYYNIDDLRKQFEEEIDAYNSAAGGDKRITLKELKQVGSVVRSCSDYLSVSDYTSFTKEPLYYGTLRQARLRGFEISQKIRAAGGGEYLISEKDDELHVIFTDGHDHIVTPYKIIACTEGVKIVSDKEADFTGTEGRSAVLLAK